MQTPELNWPTIYAQVEELCPANVREAQLALYVNLMGMVNSMDLIYAGFTDPNWLNRTLDSWRRELYLAPGDDLSTQSLFNKHPQLIELYQRIRCGEFYLQEVKQVCSAVVAPKPIQPEKPMGNANSPCQRTPGCTKQAGHTGICPGRKLKALPAPKAAKPAAKETELVYNPLPRENGKTVSQPITTPAQSQYEIRHVQGAEIVHVCTSNWSVARQAMALIETMQAA